MKYRYKPALRQFVGVVALIGLSACSGEGDSADKDEGTIIGTGITLEGTATSNKRFASNTVEVRSRSGELSTGTIDDQGRFNIATASGTGPWLLRSNLGNNDYLYGIATNVSADAQVQNLHSYSDAVVRSWYATQNMDVDTVFQSASENASMPTNPQATAIYNSLTSVVADVIADYGIAGVNLNTVEFVANGGDVDRFILQNPVIRNDRSISIIVNDPLNNTTSVAVDNYELANDLTQSDTVSPTAPTQLRALPSASDEITLVWDVATDNIGISRYAISRNGQEVVTTPYPVFIDGAIAAGTTNSYSVVAVDAAGNRSDASIVVSASPLAALDTTAPPAPASVNIDTRRGSLDLEWTLSNVSDVASFTINRGTDTNSLSGYASVNSTYFFDEAVNAGVQYCYTISAVDASGNMSAAAGPVCATMPGAVVAGVSTTTTTPPVTATDGLTAPQLDVSAMACTAEFPNTVISVDTTISAGCYLAPNDIRVTEPANLTFEAGVVVKFYTGVSLKVGRGASFTAIGTASNPIVLSGLETTPGHWTGVWFESASVKNKLDHVQIEYAGHAANNWGGLHFGLLGVDARLAMSNTTLRFNEGPGMTIEKNITLSAFDGNRYTGNAVPVSTKGNQVNVLDKRSLYTGNTLDAILVENTTIDTNLTWPTLTVPYHIEGGLTINGDFRLEPGANLMFGKDAGVLIGFDDFQLIGTAESPITFSGIDARKGSWKGLYFNSVDDVSLSHVTVQHAGGADENAAIRLFDSQRAAFDNLIISENLGFGIDAGFGSNFSDLSNVTITGNDGIANVDIKAAQLFNTAGNFTGNTVDAVEINSGFLAEADGGVVLSNSQISYHSADITLVNATLTLEAGVSLLMNAGTNISVGFGSSLITNGTAVAPVSIVGLERTAGFWDGIEYSLSASPMNRLTHTLIADGGGDLSITAANLTLVCNIGSQLKIENSQFENSAGYGLYVPARNCAVDIDAGTTFMNNALGDMN